MTDMEIRGLVEEIRAIKKYYRKGEVLLHAGMVPGEFGIVLEGCIHILREEFSGSTTLLAQGMPGEIFAEAFAAAGEPSLVTVEAARDTEVLWIHFGRMMRRSGTGRAQQILVENMMQILAKKNLFLVGGSPIFPEEHFVRKCCHILADRRRDRGAEVLRSRLTGRGLRIILRRTEVPFQRCLES